MASPSELSLDCKPHNNNYSMLLKSFGEQTDHTQKLEDFLSRLEEERLKIDAFKRELPLCMQLLSNAVETSRQQLQAYRANSNQGGRPVLEEFIPLKQYSESEVLATEKAASASATNMIISSDKANWMTTAQLWCQTTSNTTNDHHHQHGNNNSNNNKQQFNLTTIKSSPPSSQDHDIQTDIGFNITVSPNKQRINNGGAFLPFSKDRGGNTTTMLRSTSSSGLPDLALAAVSIEKDNEMEDNNNNNNNLKKCFEGDHMGADQLGKAQNNYQTDGGHATTTNTTSSNTNSSNQNHRKARRCWSPDLHRRFVNALQMLGGSQAVATPKQIRELMKVDGLTNDEVKSHLQKYRLHTRRPSPSPQGTGGGGGGQHHPQVVVLGGIWVPPEYAAAAAAAAAAAHGGGPTTTTTTTLYGAPHPHYGASPLPPQQDHHFYTTSTAPPPLPHRPHHHHSQLLHHQHHHQQQQQLHVYKSSSQTNESSPESDVRGNGDPSESIEDGKSESSSWKGDSGENGGERKGLAALREEGEESNGSEITLKF